MAKNVVASNAGVGQASVTTRIKLTIQAIQKCFYFGSIPMFVLPILIWLYFVTPVGYDVVKIHILENVYSADIPRKWRIRDITGDRKIITVKTSDGSLVQYFTPKQIPIVIRSIYQPARTFDLVLIFSIISSVFGFFFIWHKFSLRGAEQQENKRIRGANSLVSARHLDKLVQKNSDAQYTLIDVSIPLEAPMQGILAIGAQGSGKSLAIHDFMQQVFFRKRKCIIYDQSGEFYRAYFRAGKDFLFNPSCVSSVPWSIFEEIRHTYDANTLSQAFLPPKSASGQVGSNSFFEDAARALFSVILLRLAERGAVDTRDIAKAFLEMPEEEMNLLIEKSVASSAIGGDSKGQRQGVISSISIYLDGIASVGSGRWSISDFLNREDDARLFIVGSEDTKAMFAPLYRLILSVAFSAIAAKQEIVHEDKYWFFLDEIHTLGDIKVDEQLATLRKFGVCVFAGTQNDSQFITSVGKDRAESAMNGFNTLLQLRLNETNAMERAAKRLGKLEMETVSQNQAVAVVEQRDGAGIVINEQEKWLVMPSEIGQLATCQGFLKLAGAYPTARVDYSSWLPKTKGGVCRANKFRMVQDSPARDPRFVISRKVLPSGESAFDDVRRDVENEKASTAELEAENKLNADIALDVSIIGSDNITTEAGPTSTRNSNDLSERTHDKGLDF